MKKRDIIAILIVGFLSFLFIWQVVLGGKNPFIPYLKVKVTSKVDCLAGFCIYSQH